MYKNLLNFLIAVLFVACGGGEKLGNKNQDTVYQVTINLKNQDTATLYMSYRIGEVWSRDSAKSTNGVYVFNGKTPEPVLSYLRVKGVKKYDMLQFYLENAQIKINAVKDSLAFADVMGSVSNELNASLKTIVKKLDDQLNKIYEAYDAAGDNKKVTDSLEKLINKLNMERGNQQREFIFKNPDSFVAAYEVEQMFSYNPDVPKFDSVYNLLDSTIQQSLIGKMLLQKLEIAKKTDINQMAPEFALKDKSGKEVPLSSFRGKYVLIDFWASWCGPCREENPNLVKAYASFKKKGFEILGVSIDVQKDRDKWLEAIKKDKLVWTQVVDTAGWQAAVVKTYGIAGIPMNFLLDKEGKIVAKGLRGDMLEVKLKEIL